MTQVDDKPELTFTQLDAEIEALPEGPVASLNQPAWTRWWTIAGVAGMVVGLSPTLLLQWMEPAWWMVTVAQLGLVVTVVGFAPGFVRNVWVLARESRRHRRGLIEQFDHDTLQFRELSERLSAYPRDVLERQRRFARMGHERLGSRLVMMLGGIERLGLLPLLLSLFIVLRNWQDLLALPFWLAFLAAMAAILWLLGWAGAEFRRRLQLYEFILDEALFIESASDAGQDRKPQL